MGKKRAYESDASSSALISAINTYVRSDHKQSPFATYSNGERRAEQKNADRIRQERIAATITSALKEK